MTMATSKRLGVRLAAALFMAVCFIFAASSARIAADEDSPPPIFQVKFVPPPAEVRAGETFEVAAEFEVAEGVHVYKDTTVFDWAGLQGARAVRVVWPESKPFEEAGGEIKEVFEGKFIIKQELEATGKAGEPIVVKGTLTFQGCKGTLMCYPPETRYIDYTLQVLEGRVTPVVVEPEAAGSEEKAGESVFSGGGFRWFDIVLAFVLGIGISFTPCVLPMTPITSGIITSYARPGKVNAFIASLVYVLGIAVVYGILGAIVGMAGGTSQSAINSIYARGPIAALFIALALSMFGLYEIRVPGAVANKAREIGEKTRKNFLGLFFLGMVSAFVVSPCVAAPAGLALGWVLRSGDWALGFVMMFAMAWGMGLLLILAGTFTGLIPRGGPWMLYVNTAFGLVMLWAAMYFVSPWMPDGVYYLCVGLLLVAGSVFMGGWDAITAESGFGARFRRALGLLMALFGFFLAISGMVTITGMNLAGQPAVADPFTMGGEQDVDAALASGQPVVLDFWATWCVQCKELEKYTFSDPRVVEELKRFKTIRVDFDKETGLVRRHMAPGPPREVIFGSDGKERTDLSFNGYKNADEFLAILKQVK
jgi:thiol:disulfide interchange protein DsbD